MAPILSRRDEHGSPKTWIIIAAVVVVVIAIVSVTAWYIVRSVRNKQFLAACKKDPYLTRKEFTRRRKMSAMERVEEEEKQRDLLIRKTLGSRSSSRQDNDGDDDPAEADLRDRDWKRWEANMQAENDGENCPFLEEHPAVDQSASTRPRRDTSPSRAPLLSVGNQEVDEDRQSLWERRHNIITRTTILTRSPSPIARSTNESRMSRNRSPRPAVSRNRSRSRSRSISQTPSSVSPFQSPGESRNPSPAQAIRIQYSPAPQIFQVSCERREKQLPEPLVLKGHQRASSNPPTGPLPPIPARKRTKSTSRSRSRSRSRTGSNSETAIPFPDLASPPPVHTPSPHKSGFLSPITGSPSPAMQRTRSRSNGSFHRRERSYSNELLVPGVAPSSPAPFQSPRRVPPVPRSPSPNVSRSPRRKPVPDRKTSGPTVQPHQPTISEPKPAARPTTPAPATPTSPAKSVSISPLTSERKMPAQPTRPVHIANLMMRQQQQPQPQPQPPTENPPPSYSESMSTSSFASAVIPILLERKDPVDSAPAPTPAVAPTPAAPAVPAPASARAPTEDPVPAPARTPSPARNTSPVLARAPSPARGPSPSLEVSARRKPLPDRARLPSQQQHFAHLREPTPPPSSKPTPPPPTTSPQQSQQPSKSQHQEIDYEAEAELKELGIPLSPHIRPRSAEPPLSHRNNNLDVPRLNRDRSKSFESREAPPFLTTEQTPNRARSRSVDNRLPAGTNLSKWKLQVSVLDQTGAPVSRHSPQLTPSSVEGPAPSGAVLRSSPQQMPQVLSGPVPPVAQLGKLKHVDDSPSIDTPLVCSANFASPTSSNGRVIAARGGRSPSAASTATTGLVSPISFASPTRVMRGMAGAMAPVAESPATRQSPPLFVSPNFAPITTTPPKGGMRRGAPPLFMAGDFDARQQQQQRPDGGPHRKFSFQQTPPPSAGLHGRRQFSEPRRPDFMEGTMDSDTMKQSVQVEEDCDTMKQVHGDATAGWGGGENMKVSFRLSGPPDLTPEFI